MKTIKLITLILFSLPAFSLFGQTTSSTYEYKPYIEITGKAEKLIMPDEIFIGITIRERHEGKLKITIEKQETDLKEALISIGISLGNLSISNVNSNYVKVNWTRKDVMTKAKYVLKVGSASTAGKVFEKLDELQIVDAKINSVSHSKMAEIKAQVRIMAIKAAKNKADYLLEAIGEETGKPMMVNEITSQYSDGSNLNVRGARSDANYYVIDGEKVSGGDSQKEIQFQKIKVQASIYVKFEIK